MQNKSKESQMESIIDLIWEVEEVDPASVNPHQVIMCCIGPRPPQTMLCACSVGCIQTFGG